MISCDAPNTRLNYIFSCHLLAQVQIKIGRLEGERTKPTYKQLLENPLLNYAGVLQHLDLYVTVQVFANNQALCMPIKTSYKHIEKQPWSWEEWLTLPLKISDLPRNAQLAITAWDIESPQHGDVPVCGATVSLFDKYGEFRQGQIDIRMWPNRVADGNTRTSTPGILSDMKESEIEELGVGSLGNSYASDDQLINTHHHHHHHHQSLTGNSFEEFPILDELDRLAKMSKYHAEAQMIKQDWLDRLSLKEIQNAVKKEKLNSKFFFMSIEFAHIKCEDVKYKVLYYEENAERIIQTVPTNELFVVNDPELELDNIIELKNRKLEHSKQMGLLEMNLKPDTDNKNLLHKIVNYPVTRPLKREEQGLLWKYRYYLTQNKKALTKFLQCFDLNLEFEGNTLMELMLKWQPMDIEDALELLGSKYKNYPKIRSYAVSRLHNASNEDLILYLLQLVQALRYENFNLPNSNSNQNLPTIQSITTSNGSSMSGSSNGSTSKTVSASRNNLSSTKEQTLTKQQQQQSTTNRKNSLKANNETSLADNKASNSNSSSSSSIDSKRERADDNIDSENAPAAAVDDERDQADNNYKIQFSSSPPLATSNFLGNRAHLFQSESVSKKTFDSNLKTFLLQRASQNEIVALCLYWFVKVEIKDTKTIANSSSNASIANSAQTNASSSANLANVNNQTSEKYANSATTSNANASTNPNTNDTSKTNFQIFLDELLDILRNGNYYAKSIYENILNQEKFLKCLNDVVRATSRESGGRDKKVEKLKSFLKETSSSFDLVDFYAPIPLIIDPSVKISGIDVNKTTMFKSNLMPCKFVFKTLPDINTIHLNKPLEYSVIYKIGDDLRQDQLVLQMIALMDKLLKQENLDLKLTPYKVVATGIKEGFLQFIDALPMSNILANSEYRTIKEYLRKNNPSETERHGISAEAMDNYVRSCAGYMVITYILGVGDRHYDNILITKCGKILHIDFGYILGRDPKPFQPTIKWTKDMADGMGGRYGSDGKETKEYEDFKKYCCNAFLHLRRHANLILNLFSLMVDANIPDIALEPDKTVKKLIERFKLEISDEQAQYLLIKEIENNYDTIVGNITDIIHTYSVAQK